MLQSLTFFNVVLLSGVTTFLLYLCPIVEGILKVKKRLIIKYLILPSNQKILIKTEDNRFSVTYSGFSQEGLER